ncbi:MAG: hypothetical protein V3S02_02975 [Dehalococcoidales bacterium]
MTGKTPEELYQKRNIRVNGAIQQTIPDRVPNDLSFGYLPAKYTGMIG